MNDESIENFLSIGSGNVVTADSEDTSKPLVLRGVIKKDHIYKCIETNRDYYYVDTGYLGNFPSPGNTSGKKKWHRIVKNGLQHDQTFDVPDDRWKDLVKQDPRLKWTGWKNHNKKILLVMPNPKACKFYDVDYDKWVEETTNQIKENIDLPIEVRVKGSRSYRNNEYSIYDAFDSGVYATVAFNSIAALESVLYGIPAFVSVPCAATPLASYDLTQLKNPFRPSEEQILKHCRSIAYGQFTLEEISSGVAWRIINRYTYETSIKR
jgi:hypothetical protein